MTRYANGYIPQSALTSIASGTDVNGYWEHQGTPHIIAIWRGTQAYCLKKWGKKPLIRTGWNIYRPYPIQKSARDRACNMGNCLGAAYPGSSSHGGTWSSPRFTNGVRVDALAIDVNENGLSWAQVWEAARANGFLCGAITPEMSGFPNGEPWHIIDLDPYGAIPAGGEIGEIDMPLTQGEIDAIAVAVWKLRLQAKDETGADIPNVTYTAQGMLANTNGLITGISQRPAPVPAEPLDPAKVWSYRIPALDKDGRPIQGVTWSAQGTLANASAKADYEYLNPVKITDEQIATLTNAVVSGVLAGLPEGSTVDPDAIADAVVTEIKALSWISTVAPDTTG